MRRYFVSTATVAIERGNDDQEDKETNVAGVGELGGVDKVQ